VHEALCMPKPEINSMLPKVRRKEGQSGSGSLIGFVIANQIPNRSVLRRPHAV